MSVRTANIVIAAILVLCVLASFIGAFTVDSAAAANKVVAACLGGWLVALGVWWRWG